MTDDDWLPDVSSVQPITPEGEVARLAALAPGAYEKERKATAKLLGWRTTVLDEAVAAARPKQEGEDPSSPFNEVEPWTSAVGGADLLDELRDTILRFCVMPDHSVEIVAVWIAHAWAHDASDISPILVFSSPEKRCGKTTALKVVAALAPRPLHSVNISTSVVFRVVEAHRPTLLIDEADTFLAANDELRGILNGGHDRLSAWVWRSTGDDHEPKAFNVWSPKAIAMIGRVPETIEDRALAVRLRRKAKGESVERFRAAKVAELEGLRRRCARWSKDNLLRLRGIDPSVPETLNDRAQDNARALLAIADTAGGHWPNTLRAALVGNSALQSNDDPDSVGALLLRDINDIFVGASKDRLGSEALAEKLAALEESPWATWRKGFPITPRNVKKLLEPYEIKPGRDRFGAFYAKADFADALERYVAESTPEIPSHPSHPSQRHTSVTAKPSKNNELLRNDGCDGYSGVTDDNLHDPSQSEVASVTAGPIVTDFDLSNDPGNPEAWS